MGTRDMLVGNSLSAPGLEKAQGEATPGRQLLPESSFRGFLSKKEQCKHGGKPASTAKGNDGLFSAHVGEQEHPGVCDNQSKVRVLQCIESVHGLLTLMHPGTSSKGMERRLYKVLMLWGLHCFPTGFTTVFPYPIASL